MACYDYIHPAFFDLPDLEQLKILYWCTITQLTKRILDRDEAMEDVEMFVKYRAICDVDVE